METEQLAEAQPAHANVGQEPGCAKRSNAYTDPAGFTDALWKSQNDPEGSRSVTTAGVCAACVKAHRDLRPHLYRELPDHREHPQMQR
jgi:hypothetical protein